MNMDWPAIVQAEPTLIHFETEAEAAFRDGTAWFDFLVHHEADLRRLVGPLAGQPALRCPSACEAVVRHLASCWATGEARPGIGENATAPPEFSHRALQPATPERTHPLI